MSGSRSFLGSGTVGVPEKCPTGERTLRGTGEWWVRSTPTDCKEKESVPEGWI